jgi:hypothetical protein
MKIKNVTLVNKVQGRYDMIYNYVSALDDDFPLSLLDDELEGCGLTDLFTQFNEAQLDDVDPSLTKLEYDALYACMHRVVLYLRECYGRLITS